MCTYAFFYIHTYISICMYICINTYMFCTLKSSINCIMKSVILYLAFSFTVFLRFIHVDACNPNTFLLTISNCWINQFSIPVSLNIISGLLSKPLWFSPSGRLFPSSSFWLALSPPSGHNSEKIPRLPYLLSLPHSASGYSFLHITSLTSFTFHFLHLFIVWFLQRW